MIALEVAVLVASMLNLFVSIAVAGSIMKLIRTTQSPSQQTNAAKGLIELGNQPSYADIARLGSPNYDGFTPQPSNWDGVPRARE